MKDRVSFDVTGPNLDEMHRLGEERLRELFGEERYADERGRWAVTFAVEPLAESCNGLVVVWKARVEAERS